jgi:beta-xylosidase
MRAFTRLPDRCLGGVGLFFICICVGLSAQPVTHQNPVIAGDFPDPSLIRVGKDYWATATTSEWAPLFPLMHSRDLISWQLVGSVFQRRPPWSDGKYWAPEISEYRGRFYVYYVGQKKGGPLAVAVATSEKPEGPYTDHGPLVAQEAGSIDPVTAIDENGRRFLVWKEDGNSRKQPTPIWAQKLSEDGTKLVGEMKELIRNDSPWEGNLVEGPFVVKRDGWFYLFYSGNACCGRGCNYALGVARARALLGPWQKNPNNPILIGNDRWKCPGHGSIVTDARGRDFLLYHGYDSKDSVYVGRQALLDEITWGADDWPVVNAGKGPSGLAALHVTGGSAEREFFDDFTSAKLRPEWQWPQSLEPVRKLEKENGGWLVLASDQNETDEWLAAVLGLRTTAGNYEATALLDRGALAKGATAGLSAFGDRDNALGLAVRDGQVAVWRRQQNKHETLVMAELPPSKTVQLKMTATDGHRFRFAVSEDGREWKTVGSVVDVEGNYLPPWDRGVRIALTAGGPGASARFGWARVSPAKRN